MIWIEQVTCVFNNQIWSPFITLSLKFDQNYFTFFMQLLAIQHNKNMGVLFYCLSGIIMSEKRRLKMVNYSSEHERQIIKKNHQFVNVLGLQLCSERKST